MIKSIVATACLLGGVYAPLVSAAGGVPVVDRSDKPASALSLDAPVSAPVTDTVSPRQSGRSKPSVAATNVAISANAELFMMLDQLQEEVRYLRGKVEEQQHQLERIQLDQRDRYRDLDRRLSLLSQKSATVPAVVPTTLPTALVESNPAASPLASTQLSSHAADKLPTPTLSDAQAYKEAFSLVRERDFSSALHAFENFLQQYPNSSLAANVLYWTGEVYRAKPSPDQEQASIAYHQLITDYPSHPKAADAYYKLGLSYQEMGQLDKAKESMAKVIELFPAQAPASMARDFLKQHR